MGNSTGSNDVLEQALEFAVRIVNLHKYLAEKRRMYELGKQILGSGTSVGANITEANGAISKAEFSQKMSIAKECLETKYWLKVLKRTEYLSEKEYDSL